MLIAIHVRTGTSALTLVAFETYIIPQPGFLTIPPIAIATIIDIGVGKPYHKITVLQHTCLRVLEKPNSGVIIINNLLATEH
jgi:hypothetical protein